jgi:HD-like signal output (HDOD) protein
MTAGYPNRPVTHRAVPVSIDLTRLSRLPSLPTVAVKLLQRFADPDVSLASIADIVRPDAAITARLLQAASSAEFGVGRPLTDVTRAVGLLGVRRVTSLALCFSLSQDSIGAGPVAQLYRQVWLRCVVQAVSAELLARRRSRSLEAEFFTVGLLADIGRLAFLKSSPTEYAAIVDLAHGDVVRECSAEEELFGGNHSDVAIALFRQWKLPAQFCEAIRLRYASTIELQDGASGPQRPLMHSVAFASAIGAFFVNPDKVQALARIQDLAPALFAMSVEETIDLLGAIQGRVKAGAELFRTDVSGFSSAEEIMLAARDQLGQIAAIEPATT